MRLRREPSAWHCMCPLYRKEPLWERHLRGLLVLRIVSLKPISAEMSTEQAHCQLSCFTVAKCAGAKKVSPVLPKGASISVPLLQGS